MNGKGLAEVGLFLLLAFVFPGFVYLGFFILYFPNVYSVAINAFRFENNITLFILGLGVIGGLLLTSICFTIEQLFRKWEFFNKRIFPNMDISQLGVIEARGKSSLYLRQVTGQAIMHFNIATGLLFIIFPSYLVYFICVGQDYTACSPNFYVRVMACIILVVANYYLAHIFFTWGRDSIKDVKETISEK